MTPRPPACHLAPLWLMAPLIVVAVLLAVTL